MGIFYIYVWYDTLSKEKCAGDDCNVCIVGKECTLQATSLRTVVVVWSCRWCYLRSTFTGGYLFYVPI